MDKRTCLSCSNPVWGSKLSKYCIDCKDKKIQEHRKKASRRYYVANKLEGKV